jgi:Tol biopolymer transport system component
LGTVEFGGTPTRPRWTPDGQGLAYLVKQKGVDYIWVQPLKGGPPKQWTHFASGQIFNFAWSRDGNKLALARGGISGDIVVIANAR